MFRGIDDESKLFRAARVGMAIFACGLALLMYDCGVRHLPGGATAPATRFEQIMAYNAALAQANDGFADNVISLEASGVIAKGSAKSILVEQARIAAADKTITRDLQAAANCGLAAAGPSATPAQVSDASALCAKSYAAELQNAVTLITDAIASLNNGLLLPVAEQNRFKLAALLAGIQNLSQQILGTLREYSIVSRAVPVQEVQPWA